ncbi:hypothetical protein GO730_26900 [Spirosoma sp. HMF3257]|uniref:histidine kinase n=1 Tax=Spirosoma telluris TaxID=2183553 RepID=A0A327NSF9_9BACT|nr:hypothetical protein [Spirosoma telluris]RAI76886.1 hypothetical protein HMF3257_26825 [Spirosoma telluris]
MEIQQKQTTQWLIASVLGLLIVGGLTYKLNSTNQKLKKLTEAREYFISIIAHDLRRPLHMFQGMNELVSYNLKNQRFDAIEKLAKAIDDAGSNIQFMLDNLLTWALSQREVLPYHPQKLDLYPKLEEATAVFRSLYTKYPVSFSINCPDTLQIYADPNAIELILRNLIANAHKAIDTKPGNISLEAEAYETRQVIIRINDTGSGMSPAQLQTVREVLSHPLDSQTHPISSGLGLILISQFVSINRGRITVDSSLGTGTSFALVLPADKPVSSGTVQQKLLRFLRKINVSKVMP